MGYLEELNDKITSLKGIIIELEDSIDDKREQLVQASKELQEVCLHTKENVQEVVFKNYTNEFQVYMPKQDYLHRRKCSFCGKQEVRFSLNQEDDVNFKILKECNSKILY